MRERTPITLTNASASREMMLEGEYLARAYPYRSHRQRQTAEVHIILMDIHMPGMDGYHAIAAIRDWERQDSNARTQMVVISSDEIETQARSAALAGCSGYLRKPVAPHDPAAVVTRIREMRA